VNKNIINQYSINFSNIVINDAAKRVFKYPYTNSDALSSFLDGIVSDDYNINDDIIAPINVVLEGESLVEYLDSITIAEVTLDFCRFVFPSDGSSFLTPDFIMPTTDFKEIVLAWRDFLLEPPLNGSPASSSDNNFIVK
jgi:hypothetical protein